MSKRLGRPTVDIVLSGDERTTLERWARTFFVAGVVVAVTDRACLRRIRTWTQ